jgi:hypothetical protein
MRLGSKATLLVVKLAARAFPTVNYVGGATFIHKGEFDRSLANDAASNRVFQNQIAIVECRICYHLMNPYDDTKEGLLTFHYSFLAILAVYPHEISSNGQIKRRH